MWPGEPFGGADIGAEDEFMCLFDIFRMDLPQGSFMEGLKMCVMFCS